MFGIKLHADRKNCKISKNLKKEEIDKFEKFTIPYTSQ